MGGCEIPREPGPDPFRDAKLEFRTELLPFPAFRAAELLCVDPRDEDELDEEVDDEQGAMVVVLLLDGGMEEPEEDTLKLVLLFEVPFMCCCSFCAARLRSTRLMEETCERGRRGELLSIKRNPIYRV